MRCIANEKKVLSNMLILSRKQYLEKYFKKNNLKDNLYFVISDSCYFNNKIRV